MILLAIFGVLYILMKLNCDDLPHIEFESEPKKECKKEVKKSEPKKI